MTDTPAERMWTLSARSAIGAHATPALAPRWLARAAQRASRLRYGNGRRHPASVDRDTVQDAAGADEELARMSEVRRTGGVTLPALVYRLVHRQTWGLMCKGCRRTSGTVM